MPEDTVIEKATAPAEQAVDPALLEAMARAGVVYGRKKSKTHPRMRPYIFTTRNGIEMFDLTQTWAALERAGAFLQTVVAKSGMILIVGTAPAAKEFVAALAAKFKLPYVVERWLGGTLTNFKTISERLQYYLKLRADRDAGRLEKYTKKERIEFDKEIKRLTTLFGGLEGMTALPQALLIVGASKHATAVREARRMKIPIVALMSTDMNPELIDYPIPGNDNARSSIAWVLGEIEKYLEKGKAEQAAHAEKK